MYKSKSPSLSTSARALDVDPGLSSFESSFFSVKIPFPSFINTGANMTVMLTPAVMSSLPDNLDEDAYVVAIANNSGLILGSASVYDVEQTSIAIWGDDSSTPDVDGAESGELILYQLVNGSDLYDVEFTQWLSGDGSSYITNAVNISFIHILS